MAIKQIPVEDLSIGMYVVRLDRPWPDDSTLANRHRIECLQDIDHLKEKGVLEVLIDPTLGTDVDESHVDKAAAFDLEAQEDKPPSPTRTQQVFGSLARDLAMARAVRAEAMTIVEGLFEGVRTGAPINSTAVKRLVGTLVKMILRNHDCFLALLHTQKCEPNLFVHCLNVAVFSLVVGQQQGLSKWQLERLGVGALLHDVGQMRLPRNLIRKLGTYTEQERRLMQQHPRLGASIVSQSEDIHEDSRRIIVEHHERADGSGYPAGLKGLAIFPLSEIVGIADTYDAMLSNRGERPPLPPAQAIKELYQLGLKGRYDSRWVERVIRCLGIYPAGSLIELSTGERGVVTAANPLDALRPSVKIIWDSTLRPYPLPLLVHLSAPKKSEPELTILRVLDPEKENLDVVKYLEEVETDDCLYPH